MVGRSSKEVIQFTSLLLYLAVPVVRTITIERNGSGVVIRSDSGWVAIGDGLYQFPPGPDAAHPIVTHPGVVTKATNIRNIRDIPQGQGLVNFDCTLVIEG